MKTYQIKTFSGITTFAGEYTSFKECIKDAVSNNTDFTNADLSHSDLSGLILSGVNFTNTNFVGANLDKTNLSYSIFYGANFIGADLTNLNMTSSDFTGANFENAKFNSTNILNSVFTRANFKNSYLILTSFAKTVTEHADFTGVKLEDTILDTNVFTETEYFQIVGELMDNGIDGTVYSVNPFLINVAIKSVLQEKHIAALKAIKKKIGATTFEFSNMRNGITVSFKIQVTEYCYATILQYKTYGSWCFGEDVTGKNKNEIEAIKKSYNCNDADLRIVKKRTKNSFV